MDVIFKSGVNGAKKADAVPDVIRIHRLYERLPFFTYLGF